MMGGCGRNKGQAKHGAIMSYEHNFLVSQMPKSVSKLFIQIESSFSPKQLHPLLSYFSWSKIRLHGFRI